MIPDSDEYYCYQWCGRMRWMCVRNTTGRDCKWVLARSLGWIVPGRAESWGGINTENMPPEPSSPCGTMFYTRRNRLKVKFRAQSYIGWENFLKGRLSRDWIRCMDYHFQMNGRNLTGQECITKLLLGLWEHMDRIWMYHNNRFHENTSQQVARYKT
jgi:hypothetical protein